jgi:hypothetical protein
MKAESNVKLTIALSDPDLDAEELDKVTRNLLQEMNELDEVEQASLVKVEAAPEGSKALAGILLGILQAEVNVDNIMKVLGFIGDREKGKTIEMELEADGRKLKLKASNQKDLVAAIQAAQEFITAK